MAQRSWRLVAPVKGGEAAKTRLGPYTPRRAALARALALDCVHAAMGAAPAVAEVLVVSADRRVLAEASVLGARPVSESVPATGLLGAVGDGVAAAGPGPVAVLLADLPCLRAHDLVAALGAVDRAVDAGAPAAFVPDAAGTGTVLLAALSPAALRPAFGPGSAAAHERDGAVRLDLRLPRLRRDVDTPRDLDAALALGVGPRTAAALAAETSSA